MEFSREFWKSHQKGNETRAEILALLRRQPGISKREISQIIQRSVRQTERHLSWLFAEGKVTSNENGFCLQRHN
jgi:DNA-binding transcriptional ArsR family regulator